MAIAFDKPYQIGDELHLDDIVGTVERIGIKSTRLRSIDGEQIIIANGQMLQAKLKNFGRAPEQRITIVLTLAFDSPVDTLRDFPALIEQVIAALPASRLQSCYLRGLGSAGFEFEVSFFANAPSESPPTQLRQQFMLQLLAQLERHGIGFASAGAPVLALKPAPAPASPVAQS